MKLEYFPDTDSLYIDLSSRPSVDSLEVQSGIVLDFDEHGNLTGIDIDKASQKLNLRELSLSKVSFESQLLVV
ncbi:MAG: DUF2283 domain-containing protein [Herpetosiphonaceae bacterium]|nr:DUF2283 domain-containing protein [Herpetosiphonaceae bacterium]